MGIDDIDETTKKITEKSTILFHRYSVIIYAWFLDLKQTNGWKMMDILWVFFNLRFSNTPKNKLFQKLASTNEAEISLFGILAILILIV